MSSQLQIFKTSAFILFLFCALSCNVRAQNAVVPSGTGSPIATEQAQEVLDFHNKARADVKVAPLEWSADLSGYAQKWAEHLAAGKCVIAHRPEKGEWAQLHGENIFWGSGPQYTTADALKGWYGEIKDYTFEPLTEHSLHVVGHYTQMVSKFSTKMGMGLASCPSGAVIIVANYDPPGNYMGEKPY